MEAGSGLFCLHGQIKDGLKEQQTTCTQIGRLTPRETDTCSVVMVAHTALDQHREAHTHLTRPVTSLTPIV